MTTGALRVVLYEGEGSRPLPSDDRYAILRSLLEKGYSVTRSLPGGRVGAAGSDPLLVLGDFEGPEPPTAEDAAGAVPVQVRGIAEVPAEQVVSLVEEVGQSLEAPKPGGWKPWFPVIDYDRCTNCMQCLSFCLFDVYGVKDGKIDVRNQNHCKTDCPACSRVCPEVAILFPKYRSGPINGDEINEEDLRREAMKVDISALLGGDIYQMLRDRSEKAKSRFSKERDESRALKERMRCLAQLQKDLDIPPEVLATLPSAEQIQSRLANAAEEGQA
ncbi:MAG: ferredoxin family protein [Armatimonadota bacterium]